MIAFAPKLPRPPAVRIDPALARKLILAAIAARAVEIYKAKQEVGRYAAPNGGRRR